MRNHQVEYASHMITWPVEGNARVFLPSAAKPANLAKWCSNLRRYGCNISHVIYTSGYVDIQRLDRACSQMFKHVMPNYHVIS